MVNAHCSFCGVSIAKIDPGVDEVDGVTSRDDNTKYLDNQLSKRSNVWRSCSWHKNQKGMLVYGKFDATLSMLKARRICCNGS